MIASSASKSQPPTSAGRPAGARAFGRHEAGETNGRGESLDDGGPIRGQRQSFAPTTFLQPVVSSAMAFFNPSPRMRTTRSR
ncbi:MAG: hypothetical protein K0R89_3417 [Ramlibacter sp.]|nr:hypothetical protein [Ramlibacter sp.]